MRHHLLFWLILIGFGALLGHRYGVPNFVTGMSDPAFEAVEGIFGGSRSDSEEYEDFYADFEEEDVNETAAAESEEPSRTEPPAPASGDLGHEANANLRINDAGLQIIKESEGLRLEAYNLGGQWLIGYGHARTARSGMKITEAQAEQLLREDVRDAENGVRRLVVVPVNENQFSAMVSLAYNLGVGGFGRSTVLENLNKGNYSRAGDAFLNHNTAGGKVNEHLTHRREMERDLFNTPA